MPLPRGSWDDNKWKMIMNTPLCTPAAEGGRARSRIRAPIATLKTWCMAYLTRRIERVAILQLQAMSDRQLEDIGLTRSQIEGAVRGESRSRAPTNFDADPQSPGPVTGRGC